jgi:ribosomal protein S18 acetylase RimI-like enzyme
MGNKFLLSLITNYLLRGCRNVEIAIVRGKEINDSGLDEQIIEFDRINMKPILEAAGIEFPEERRREAFTGNSTFIIAFDHQRIAGYIEYRRSWNDADYIYISSIQIDKKYRNTSLIIELLDNFRSLVSAEEFAGFETNVQKVNARAVKMYQKIGFRLEDNPHNEASWLVRADRKLLEDSPVLQLINRWRKKRIL